MQKNKWLYRVAAVLVLITAIVLLLPMIKNLGKSDKEFAVKDVSKITRICLISSTGDTSDLTLDNGIWHVNHQYKVRSFAIENLLQTIKEVKADYPVSNAGHNNVIKEMMQTNTRVAIYTGAKEPEKVYYVGGPNVSNSGTFMIMEIDGKMAKRPYVTSVLGGAGYLTGNYSAIEMDWRSREIFSYKPAEIKKIKIEYIRKPGGSFEIDNKDSKHPKISALNASEQIPLLADERRLTEYVSYYNAGFSENYVNDYEHIDTILMTAPYCIISITDQKGVENTVRIYHKPVTERTKQQVDAQGNPMEYDMDKFIGYVNRDKSFVLIQFYSFGKFFKKYNQFFDIKQSTATIH